MLGERRIDRGLDKVAAQTIRGGEADRPVLVERDQYAYALDVDLVVRANQNTTVSKPYPGVVVRIFTSLDDL